MEINGQKVNQSKEEVQDESHQFYLKYLEEYYKNVQLVKQLLSAVTDNQRLEEELKDISDTNESNSGKRKRHRRPAHEIRRHHKCPAPLCGKAYGSEGSLSQHLKLKHRSYYEQYSKLVPSRSQTMSVREEKSDASASENPLFIPNR
ncbi:unnamed protein product [Moneuplotes crassus]|uniref:C2H2-type domain-containing protein n=1 Tax=Euplotes crassus TaxID=5936 RepID=A0AAD1Y209_EUPCR|nr:unnamed protein product [Moneuplotes crassus]